MKTTKLTPIAGLALALIIALPSHLHGTQDDAVLNAAIIGSRLEITGDWVVRGFATGKLYAGQTKTLETRLVGGVTYRFIAAGCDDADDVDIRLYDDNWNLIDMDNDGQDRGDLASRIAIADVTPRRNGRFYIRVTLHSCVYGESAAHWSLQLAYQK